MPTSLRRPANQVGSVGAGAVGGGWRGACSPKRAMRLRPLFLAAGLLAGGCNTPSVPLPPPDLPALSFSAPSMGTVELVGMPSSRHASVLFFVFNRSRGDGVIQQTGADGSFTTEPFDGNAGDQVQLYYQTGTRVSDAALCNLAVGTPLNNICQ